MIWIFSKGETNISRLCQSACFSDYLFPSALGAIRHVGPNTICCGVDESDGYMRDRNLFGPEKVSHFSTPSFDHAFNTYSPPSNPNIGPSHRKYKEVAKTTIGKFNSLFDFNISSLKQYSSTPSRFLSAAHVTGQQPIRQRNSCDAGANEPIAVPNAVIHAGELGDSSRQPTRGRSFCRCSTRHHVN
ncbi:hypothetical protein ACJJTC_006406 [Scirpophaga incertulas]